ncbi:hypothetical protein JTE90_020028 [Oedothorax gibbosus]|uniref:Kazal-like domain-containing protein n=1 Tax=Oedothorax gibbosus TaxID=931172 RepID=A0AAV6USB7_9ARAC|nr:hypothetical protein JTE90_020028 [Oedothorax gibbosus]
MYFAILFVLRLLGPLLGFAMASFCLKYFENPFDDPGYGPDDPRWVGAWWIGFVLEGFLLLLVAIPISMFPKMPPGVKKPINRPETDKRVNFSGMFAALKRVLLNSLLWVIMVNDIISLYGTVGHHIMLPKYMEHQFRLTASDASLYSGVPGLAAVMVSVLLGGYLVWKFRPTVKFLFGSMIVLEVIGACGFLILMIPKCEKLEMAYFGMEDDGLILEGSCNMNCNCSRKSFTPVCGSDLRTLYFSPCYAGCEKSLNKTFFNNCSCIPELGNFEKYATEGFCMPESCWQQALTYIIAWPTIQFIVSLLRVMQQVLLLRCTQHQDKSLALAMFEGITVVLGIVPYLVIFGSMVDSACLVFESSCEETGNCWFYDTDKLNNILHGMSAGFSFLSVGTMYLLYTMRDRFSDMYEEDIFNEEKKDVDENPDAKKADE